MSSSIGQIFRLGFVGSIFGVFLPSAAAANDLMTDGTIIGEFSDVRTSGIYLNYPALGDDLAVNNSGTAVYSITNSTDTALYGTPPIQTNGSSLKWGAYPPGYGIDTEDSFSELNFFGGQVPSDIHQNFQIGTFTYLNGTSTISSQIFGAQISFYDNIVSASSYLGTDTIYISTTSNFGQSLSQDADWINVCGNGSNICDTRVEAFEDSEGGTGVTVNLFGSIVGDPTLDINSVSLAPGQNDIVNGFIGSGPQMATGVPEPTTWAFMLIGFCGLGFLRYRRGQIKVAAAPSAA